jgi:hypothetical protein
MNTTEILKAGRAKIEQGWSQGANTRDEDGNAPVANWLGILTKPPVRWCTYGAVVDIDGHGDVFRRTTSGHDKCHELLPALGLLKMAIYGEALAPYRISAWNDEPNRTKEDVLAAYDRAIALAIWAGDDT